MQPAKVEQRVNCW